MEANRNDNVGSGLQEGAGRTNNTQGGELKEERHNNGVRDISDIDQQEGDMSNGTLGGNLGSIDREKDSSNKP